MTLTLFISKVCWRTHLSKLCLAADETTKKKWCRELQKVIKSLSTTSSNKLNLMKSGTFLFTREEMEEMLQKNDESDEGEKEKVERLSEWTNRFVG